MISVKPTLLVVTGLQREARIARGPGVFTLCSGGNADTLRTRLQLFSCSPSRPDERARPASRKMGSPPAPSSSAETRPSGAPQDEGAGATLLPFKAVLSFGLAGGLAPHLRSGDVVLSSAVEANDGPHPAHEGWHDSAASALAARLSVHRGATAGHDLVLAKASEKISLHRATGALAVDMESHIAAEFARRHGLPFMAIRAVSDPCTRNLPPIAMDALTPDGRVAVGKVIMGLLRETDQVPGVIAAGVDSERAFASLRRCRRLLGPLFGLGRADL